jgi:AbrB family looped-hinge helix DNA binding protein
LASLERGPVSWTGEVDLTTASYESALQIAASLSRDEQLRLIRELTIRATRRPVSGEETSVLALCGLGQEIWQHMDAQRMSAVNAPHGNTLPMTIHCTLDDAGRVVIPKEMREALHLEPGDTLEIERPERRSFCARLRKFGSQRNTVCGCSILASHFPLPSQTRFCEGAASSIRCAFAICAGPGSRENTL